MAKIIICQICKKRQPQQAKGLCHNCYQKKHGYFVVFRAKKIKRQKHYEKIIEYHQRYMQTHQETQPKRTPKKTQ